MLSKKMQKALNDQINAELYSAYLYYAMSAYAFTLNLNGFAKWLKVQAMEELTHAQRIFGHIVDRNGTVALGAMQSPPAKWESIAVVFEGAYKHEQEISRRIDNLVNMAVEEQDHASNAFLQWFVNEQVEEELSAYEIMQKIKMVGASMGGLLYLDKEAGKREFGSES